MASSSAGGCDTGRDDRRSSRSGEDRHNRRDDPDRAHGTYEACESSSQAARVQSAISGRTGAVSAVGIIPMVVAPLRDIVKVPRASSTESEKKHLRWPCRPTLNPVSRRP